MPYRIEEYRLEIIRSAIDVEKIKNKSYEMPEVIPIVIYTGKRDWNAKLYLHSIQDERFKNVNLQRYNLIDINKYEKEELINSEYLIDKMFLIESAKNREEAEKSIIQAIESIKDEQDKAKLIRIIKATLIEKIDPNKLENIIKNKKGEDEVMEAVIEMLRYEAIKEGIEEGLQKGLQQGMQQGMQQGIQKGIQQGMQQGMQQGIQKGRKEGVKETIINIISNMLQKGMEVEEIEELTGATKREIEQIKKQLNKE